MRTVRSSSVSAWGGGVCPGRGCLLGEGVSARGGGVCPEVSAQGRLCPGGCLPDRMTDRCKTLPCRNYVASGKNKITDTSNGHKCPKEKKNVFFGFDFSVSYLSLHIHPCFMYKSTEFVSRCAEWPFSEPIGVRRNSRGTNG